MYNDDDVKYVKKDKIVHYGTLENSVRMLQQPGPSSIPANVNINVSNQYFDLKSTSSMLNSEKQNALEELERKRKARQIAVSTDDVEVRAHLRHLNQPMCLFGEGPADRRERLRQLLARIGEDAIKKHSEEKGTEEKEVNKIKFFITISILFYFLAK